MALVIHNTIGIVSILVSNLVRKDEYDLPIFIIINLTGSLLIYLLGIYSSEIYMK